jgi:Fic family protein
MATLVRGRWTASFEGMGRRDRRGCDYDAYLPDPLAGWDLTLPADLAADIADAETEVRRLNARTDATLALEGLARFLLRAESVASSRIEGLGAGPRRLLEAEAVLAEGGDAADRESVEVIGNIAAMQSAIALGAAARPITLSDLLAIHGTLMGRSPTPNLGGVVRTTQNWIGGSSHNPCSAGFVPPPPDSVPALLHDLLAYVNGDAHPAIVHAAIAHAQFETIHPFADGNGRTGRALLHVVLRQRGLTRQFVPPVSLVLAAWATDYVAGLTSFRHLGTPDSPERSTGAHAWLRTFAAAIRRSCTTAETYVARMRSLDRVWRSRLKRVRASSAVDLLLGVLPGVPVLTVGSAARLIDRSTMRTGEAVNRLVAAGILRQRNAGRQRYRVFEAHEVVRLVEHVDRALADPAGERSTRDEPT